MYVVELKNQQHADTQHGKLETLIWKAAHFEKIPISKGFFFLFRVSVVIPSKTKFLMYYLE